MDKKIKWNDRALNKFHAVALYLEEEYSTQTSENLFKLFLQKLKHFKNILPLVEKRQTEKPFALC